ncbi:hypothetical protein E0Z10_g3313 [Xylaria hypoxylon]|uniref:Uncharacterized protein n=1 Tax=Xylaria hypoxylon TaxID=37992 RepID=A0A4Z0Z247_9PEZI|nr:hypothetical protein E0Z10_g3313 [Xylaria hypoxylon]
MATMLAFILFSLYCETLAANLGKAASTVNGGALYYGTAVDNGPAAVPTIVYNCDRLRAICWNLNEFMTDATNPGYGAVPLFFHYDGDRTRKNTRRAFSCPRNWQTFHLRNRCGSVTGQPNVVPGNLPPIVVQPIPETGPQLWTPSGPRFNNEIPNLTNTASSGMFFSCEEMPAASWIEGGEGGPPFVHVNCAPMDVSCQNLAWRAVRDTGYPHTRSEQNWQADAHAAIARYANLKSGGAGTVMRFALSIENLGAASATAARVILPAFGNSPANTFISNKRTDVPEPETQKWYIECEGAFCHDLNADPAFNFDDIRAPPPPPTPAAAIGIVGQVDSDGPEETGESATLYIMA